jgi:hypothetical protein
MSPVRMGGEWSKAPAPPKCASERVWGVGEPVVLSASSSLHQNRADLVQLIECARGADLLRDGGPCTIWIATRAATGYLRLRVDIDRMGILPALEAIGLVSRAGHDRSMTS